MMHHNSNNSNNHHRSHHRGHHNCNSNNNSNDEQQHDNDNNGDVVVAVVRDENHHSSRRHQYPTPPPPPPNQGITNSGSSSNSNTPTTTTTTTTTTPMTTSNNTTTTTTTYLQQQQQQQDQERNLFSSYALYGSSDGYSNNNTTNSNRNDTTQTTTTISNRSHQWSTLMNTNATDDTTTTTTAITTPTSNRATTTDVIATATDVTQQVQQQMLYMKDIMSTHTLHHSQHTSDMNAFLQYPMMTTTTTNSAVVVSSSSSLLPIPTTTTTPFTSTTTTTTAVTPTTTMRNHIVTNDTIPTDTTTTSTINSSSSNNNNNNSTNINNDDDNNNLSWSNDKHNNNRYQPPSYHQRKHSHSNSSSIGNNRETNQYSQQQQPPTTTTTSRSSSSFKEQQQQQQQYKICDITTCLFAEQVICYRPLFFGPIISPMILQKIQSAIHTAIADHMLVLFMSNESSTTSTSTTSNESSTTTSSLQLPTMILLQDLPPSIRNMMGVLRTYGYGLDKYVYNNNHITTTSSSLLQEQQQQQLLQPSILLKGSSGGSGSSGASSNNNNINNSSHNNNNNNTNHSYRSSTTGSNPNHQSRQHHHHPIWRGNGTLSTFQPVWGSNVRAERLQAYYTATTTKYNNKNKNNKNHHLQKPNIVSRFVTAPAELVSQSPDRYHDGILQSSPDRYNYDNNNGGGGGGGFVGSTTHGIGLHTNPTTITSSTTTTLVDQKYHYEDNDDDDDDDDDYDEDHPNNDDDENDSLTIVTQSQNEIDSDRIPNIVRRHSSTNTTGSNLSNGPGANNNNNNNSHRTMIMIDTMDNPTSIAVPPPPPPPPNPNDQFSAWLRNSTQQLLDHNDFVLSKKTSNSNLKSPNVAINNNNNSKPKYTTSNTSTGSTNSIQEQQQQIVGTSTTNITVISPTSTSMTTSLSHLHHPTITTTTATTTTTSTTTGTSGTTPVVFDQNMFALWVQAGNNDSTPTNFSSSNNTGTLILDNNNNGSTSTDSPFGGSNNYHTNATGTFTTTTVNTTGGNSKNNNTTISYDGSTFQRIPDVGGSTNDHPDDSNNTNDNSDDDSVIDDEQNTQVGANDNLSKAVAMFSDGFLNQSNDLPLLEESKNLLSQVDGSRKRPMTNYELTGGYVPMFGIDDTPLPQLSDLGTYETEEDQQRALEQKRSQDIIEKFVPPNVFGSVACPNPAIGPDDFHSWNSRSVPHIHGHHNSMTSIPSTTEMAKRTGTTSTGPVLNHSRSTVGATSSSNTIGGYVPQSSKPPRPRGGTKSPRDALDVNNQNPRSLASSRDRYGWWYENNEIDDTIVNDTDKENKAHTDDMDCTKEDEATTDDPSLQLPPLYHSSSKMQIVTDLEPTAETLQKENLPLSQMHAATSMVQELPYLSDRPHSYRYLQIDTKQIAFPPLKGEIEPLFCSLAIYNVETISSNVGGGMISSSGSNTKQPAIVPIPDLQRCGRVTEALHFDHVIDPDVERRCEGALWPYQKSQLLTNEFTIDERASKLRGTSCGIFPLPSNLNVANLYAVLIVRKVLSEESDLEPYYKQRIINADLDKMKQNAERASNKNGAFLIPFAFGVAPLQQVFGSDNPVIALSRAVQIPLFHLSDGESQIIDHIMVMLFPRADLKGLPAAVTNGGTAMLVMRNFGYLGLHHVLNQKSSLARHRLVDFTGEIQVRRRNDDDPVERREKRRDSDNYRLKLSPWHPLYIAEPVPDGGRIVDESSSSDDNSGDLSKLYAQELIPVPLLLAPASSLSAGAQLGISQLRYDDIEPIYHTTFCNELLCHPRILHNCEQGNYSIKVELREIEWNESMNVYFAHLPRHGINPCIHNPRRGPFLVPSAFTSCTSNIDLHHFIDEFKIKLPLDLTPREIDGKTRSLSLFFTVYRIKTHSKSKWKAGAKMLFGPALLDAMRFSGVKAIACGFLPLAPQSCLLDDGIHDVRIAFTPKAPPQELKSDSLMLVEREVGKGTASTGSNNESLMEDMANSLDSRISDSRFSDVESSVQTDDSSIDFQISEKSGFKDHISLSVRIVSYSSVHAQNVALTDFLNQESESKPLAFESNKYFYTSLRMGIAISMEETMRSLSERMSRSRENRLLESIVAIADSRQCPMAQVTGHLLRVMSLLWRTFIFGDGEPDVDWANPSAPLPLRVNAFATILHLVGATSLYLSKSGFTQVDGTGKFSFVMLGRVLALLFDEFKLFKQFSLEKFDPQYWTAADVRNVTKTSKKSPPKGRHIRQTYELGQGHISPVNFSSVSHVNGKAGDLATLPPVKHSDGVANQFSSVAYDKLTQRTMEKVIKEHDFKVDSKHDFQNLIRLSAEADVESEIHLKAKNDELGKDKVADLPGKSMMSSFSGVAGRRYMTMPAPLSTILESSDDLPSYSERNESRTSAQVDMVDFEMRKKNPTDVSLGMSAKQMRRPKFVKGVTINSDPLLAGGKDLHEKPAPIKRFITSDDIFTSMGDAFLDKIPGLELNASTSSHDMRGLDGQPRHRRQKTKSASSIDWSEEDTNVSQKVMSSYREPISTLASEEATSIELPPFFDRLSIISKSTPLVARWFPYAYEVIIMQWSLFLVEQRKSGEKSTNDKANGDASYIDETLNQAAMRAIGVTVASAPMLFEVIKQSLGFRVKHLFDTVLSKRDLRSTPPLVTFDDTLMSNLLQVVSMLTDACIDSRNFDSVELRQMSIDVNDSIVRFLRDLFSFLNPCCVHRLILTYLSRFLTKEGKNFADRDSLIGLRCSWEISKLRLNAITAFIRFPDFIKINGPQMLSWDRWWTGIPPNFKFDFFEDILTQYSSFNLPQFVGIDESNVNEALVIPPMNPHWLAEIAIDICLSGTEHVEQYIQHRSASLLYELVWSCSQKSILKGISAPVASMFITLIEKIAKIVSYLSNFSPKSELRKDTLTPLVFVLQSAPPNLLRALWRRLIARLKLRLPDNIYVSVKQTKTSADSKAESMSTKTADRLSHEPNILSIFSILNLSLRTMEYEGSDENIEGESSGENRENVDTWRKEYLLCRNQDKRNSLDKDRGIIDHEYSTSRSRQWQSHDASMVIVNTGHQIILEMSSLLGKASTNKRYSNQLARSNCNFYRPNPEMDASSNDTSSGYPCSLAETILFVRGVTSVYLQALSLRESDIVVAKALEFSAKVIESFGIKTFIDAVGETLQHWMRVISYHCGARRALVRIEATDLLELLLRSTWDCFGSFFRIRVPLLAVQTEVMERIVAISAARYYREQRRLKTNFENFTNLGAEASLVPLWRSLDRIQKRPASQQIAYKRALIRIAGKLKNLYRAYIAARVLSYLRSNNEKLLDDDHVDGESIDFNPDSKVRALQISILRVINASEGYSKLFLGLQGTSQQRNSIAHYEAIEDSLVTAANVFSPTELPGHRVEWLRMLANFHHSRKKYAEEACCHYRIHVTLHLAARLHGSLWSNTPFLPWTDNTPNPIVYIDSDGAPAADPDYLSESNVDDWEIGGNADSSSSFRRIFYRVANSIGFGNNEWESGESKTLFNGILYAAEYDTISPWMTLREMEEDMVEEVEAAGALFLEAGVVDSSRFVWNLATQHYAEKFNYSKLAIAYANLARVVISQVPSIDTSLPQEVTTTLGRFYRVWFHGGAPDDLNGIEFVYRSTSRLKEFGEELRSIIMSIIPSKTPINLVFDGTAEETVEENPVPLSGYLFGQAPLEPVRIKVTPLRPLFDRYVRTRGLPEWFYHYADEMFSSPLNQKAHEYRDTSKKIDSTRNTHGEGYDPHHSHGNSFSATLFSSVGSTVAAGHHLSGLHGPTEVERPSRFTSPSEGDLTGVDKFCFVQPKNRAKPMEWWKPTSGDFTEKSLRVTQLQVAESFPACITRQPVVNRLVFSQSPLEAGIDAVCQWCAILFQTTVATSGMRVLKTNSDPGIGIDAAKVVADCIHNSRVKEIGLSLLRAPADQQDRSIEDFTTSIDSGRLSGEEIAKLQLKLARLIVAFVELLHLLIGRNRDMLLEVIQERKKNDNAGSVPQGSTVGRGMTRQTSTGQRSEGLRKAGSVGPYTTEPTSIPSHTGMHHRRNCTDASVKSEDARGRSLHNAHIGSEDNQSYQSAITTVIIRTEQAIAVQSELQRAFISLTKALYKNVHGVLQEETPRWFKQIGQDNYFSQGTYLQTKIPIAEELCFLGLDVLHSDTGSHHPFTYVPSFHSDQGYDSPRGGSIAGGSQSGTVVSKGSERYGYGQF